MHTKEKKDIDEKTKEYLILLAGCVCKGYWEQQEILEEIYVIDSDRRGTSNRVRQID